MHAELVWSICSYKLMMCKIMIKKCLYSKTDILFCSITHANLGQFSKPVTDLESAGLEVFKTPPTCAISPSFHWDIWG